MRIVAPLLELFVVTWAVWAAVFQIALVTRAATGWLPWAFLIALSLAVLPWRRRWLASVRTAREADRRFAVRLGLVATILALVLLFTSRPDKDDLGYLEGPLEDAFAPTEPLRLQGFQWTGREVADLSFLHENEAYEAFVVVTSRLLGVDPLTGYHNLFLIVSVFAWCATLAVMLAQLRVRRGRIVGVVAIAALLLLLEGGSHQSYGNMGLVRLWQGKIVAWSVCLPIFVLFQWRLLVRPGIGRLGLLLLAGFVGISFSRTTVVLLAVAGLAVPLAYLLAFGPSAHRIRRVAWGLAGVFPIWGVGVLVVLSITWSSPGSWTAAFPDQWTAPASAGLAFEQVLGGSWTRLARYLLLFLVAPVVALRGPLGRFVVLQSALILLLSWAPPWSALWHVALGDVVWRLAYALQLPLSLALLASTLKGPNRSRRLVLSCVVVALWLPHFAPVLSRANGVEFKAPLAHRFPRGVRAFLQAADDRLDGQRVLAAEEVAVALALSRRGVDLPVTRPDYAPRGRRRDLEIRAHRLLSRCEVRAPFVRAVVRLTKRERPAFLVLADCGDDALTSLASSLGRQTLHPVLSAGGYQLFEIRSQSRRGRRLRNR